MISNQFGDQEAPSGFELPKAAVDLLNTAALSRWVTGWRWEADSDNSPFVSIHIADKETGEYFRYVWHSRDTGTLRLFSKLHQESRGRQWEEGPSVKAAVFRMREVAAQRS
ncbi:hypothetical protein ADL27_38590 [Streptomyces sp. NRRL F-6602]|nr:hypothetical protein ADL27_38590 [Streptomyces sp. NRRL F-6602]